MSRSKHWKSEWEMFIGSDGRRKYTPFARNALATASRVLRRLWWTVRVTSRSVGKADFTVAICVENRHKFAL